MAASPAIWIFEPTGGERQASLVRVLVVDDFEDWRQMVCLLLENARDLVVDQLVSNGPEAVLRAHAMQPELIIMDISLPGLNGIDACRRIRQLCPRTRILILSVSSDLDVVRAAFDAGADGYVLKTDAYLELQPGARIVAAGRQFVSSGLATPYRMLADSEGLEANRPFPQLN